MIRGKNRPTKESLSTTIYVNDPIWQDFKFEQGQWYGQRTDDDSWDPIEICTLDQLILKGQ